MRRTGFETEGSAKSLESDRGKEKEGFILKKRRENNLGTDAIQKLVPRIALPAMLAQFVNVLYSIVDRMYIGNIAETGELR